MTIFFKDLDQTYINANFNGYLVLGDIHGMLSPFVNAIKFAKNNNLFIVQLGDVVDYGLHSKEVIHLARQLIEENKAEFILGNHERKLHRYFVQKKNGDVRVKIKPALRASIDSFNTEESISNFFFVHDKMINVLHGFSKNEEVFFAHGGVHPDVIRTHEYSPLGFQYSLFGEVDNKLPVREDGFPNRVFNWIKDIPSNVHIFIGHDIRSMETPVIDCNAFFMDCGSGKGGNLYGAVLDKNFSFKNFQKFDID